METMSVEFWDNSVAPLTTGQRNFPQYTRPFDSWEAIARIYPNHLEVHHFMRQPEVDCASLWYRRRAHAPCDVRVPPEWGLDALYLRHKAERAYCERLRRLRARHVNGSGLPGSNPMNSADPVMPNPGRVDPGPTGFTYDLTRVNPGRPGSGV
jgi:hypothetical protein